MKKIILLISALTMLSVLSLKADNDKPITYDQLPEKAKTFIQTHFADQKVSFAKLENDFFDKNYEVVLVNGTKIEFFEDGDWKEINCKYSKVPLAIIPVEITQYLNTNFPESSAVEIEKKSRKYEVKLDNSVEIEFDLKFNVVDIDY